MEYSVRYVIQRDLDGKWCIYGSFPNGVETTRVYANTWEGLVAIFTMIEGSGFLVNEVTDETENKTVKVAE